MTAFWPTRDRVTPGRRATEGRLIMERWDDTCSPAAQARRFTPRLSLWQEARPRTMNEPTTAARPQPVLRDRAAMVHAPAERRPRVVVVGAGFGGLRAARALRQAPVDVVLVDRHNYHLFQPLLYQVATAGLEPEQIARPVRAI